MSNSSLRLRILATLAMVASASLGISTASAQVVYTGTDNSPAIVGPDYLGYSVLRYFSGPPILIDGPGVITSFDVSITFTKIPDFADDSPYYDEIGFDLLRYNFDGSLAGDLTLFAPGDFWPGTVGTFFDGTLHFTSDATVPVNVDPNNLMPGTYAPLGPIFGDMSAFAPGDFFALSLTDATAGNPLIYSSSTLVLNILPVPEASVYAWAGGSFLVLLVAVRRRRSARPVQA